MRRSDRRTSHRSPRRFRLRGGRSTARFRDGERLSAAARDGPRRGARGGQPAPPGRGPAVARSSCQLQEAIEQVAGVVRAGARLGVVLDGGAGDVAQDQALDRAVVEVQLRELGDAEVGLPADRLVALDPRLAAGADDGEAVVLGGDVDPARLQVLDRVVGAAVAEGQLVGLAGRRRGRAAGGRGRCRRPASCRSRRGRCRRRSRGRRGRRGRWRGRRRRGPRRAPPRGCWCRAAGSAGSRARAAGGRC